MGFDYNKGSLKISAKKHSRLEKVLLIKFTITVVLQNDGVLQKLENVISKRIKIWCKPQCGYENWWLNWYMVRLVNYAEYDDIIRNGYS